MFIPKKLSPGIEALHSVFTILYITLLSLLFISCGGSSGSGSTATTEAAMATDEQASTETLVQDDTEAAADDSKTATTLSLIGDSTVVLAWAETYGELGAMATDSNGNDISHMIVIDSNYDPEKMGTFSIHYTLPVGVDGLSEALTLSRTVRKNSPGCPIRCAEGCIQFAANSLQCSTDIPDAVALSDAISIDLSQNDCYAPCGIHFQAHISGDFAVDSPFHHLAYHWQFGDPGAYFRSLENDFPFSNDANRAQGSQAGHVFAVPGEYQVTLRVAAKNGRFAEASTTVRVLDPSEHFSPGQTLCLSSSSRFDGCPSGATELTSWPALNEWITASNMSRTGSYVLLRAGDEFTAQASLLLRSGRHLFTRFGEGADPVIKVSDNLSVFYTLTPDELSVSYLTIQGDYTSHTGLGDAWRSRGFFLGWFGGDILTLNATIYRMTLSGLGICIYANGGIGHIYADNHCSNWQDYGALHGGIERSAFIGNSLKQDLNAKGGPDTKLFSITEHSGDGSTRTFSYDFNLAGDHDLGIRIVNSDKSKDYFSDQQGYTLDLGNT